jgi:hypothetical protein
MPDRSWMIRITANDIINIITFDSIDLLTEDENWAVVPESRRRR